MNQPMFSRMLGEAQRSADDVTGRLLQVGALRVDEHIDEISYLFDDPRELQEFVWYAKDAGLGMGDAEERQVAIWPPVTGEIYETEYHFVQVSEDLRIEAMYIRDGIAPLHDAHSLSYAVDQAWCMVHASFKTKTTDDYALAQINLNDRAGLSLRREYKNGYGIFSYWAGIPAIYVKPRLNLRDGIVD